MKFKKNLLLVLIVFFILLSQINIKSSAWFHGNVPARIIVIPLNVAVVEGTRLADDLSMRNGLFGWIRGWMEIAMLINEKNDIWRQAGIQFRLRCVVLIPDPIPPIAGGAGQQGDILDPTINIREYNALLNLADRRINQRYKGIACGLTDIKIRFFVDRIGNPTTTLGRASAIPPPCKRVPILKAAAIEPNSFPNHPMGPINGFRNPGGGFNIVNGRVSRAPQWQPGVVEAHENGHLLGLRHPAGVGWPPAPPPSANDRLMAQTWARTDTLLTNAEITTAREYAEKHVPSTRIKDKESGEIISHIPLSSIVAVDDIDDVPYSFIDITDFDFTSNLNTNIMNFSVILNKVLPDLVNISITFMMNLDNNNETGVTTYINGTDAIAEIYVSKIEGIPKINYNLTIFINNETIDIFDPSIEANLITLETENCRNLTTETILVGDMVYISIPKNIFVEYGVPIVENFSVIASSMWDEYIDITPVLNASFVLPQEAELHVNVANGLPGESIEISGEHFTKNSPVWIFMDDIKLKEIETDENGHFFTFISIPLNISCGNHSLWAFSPTENANGDLIIFEVKQDKIPPTVKIIQPKNGYLYLFNREIFKVGFTIVIGDILIKVDAFDKETGIERIDFYINDVLKFSDYGEPYEWLLEEKIIGKCTIKVIAYDKAENIQQEEMNIWIFNI